ncbi:hypothetical protein J4573_00250 [Actinomadura barringtoniae]|uniref:MFS transporter n=1 Tax=Actinomadura barringtoniae TaxID=1427535 RepID=A0A939P5D3_9ACTN|nr:hypothetical protein [Actinomadura barringtoniae]MBO2445512.1 hypothetical protein [Actinomadura barringtoniae]
MPPHTDSTADFTADFTEAPTPATTTEIPAETSADASAETSADASAETTERSPRVREALTSAAVLLATLAALPAVAVTLPNTSLNVLEPARDALGITNDGLPDLVRAAGLTLPAALLAVPVAAVAARRFSARLVFLTGLLLLGGGLAAARLAGSVPILAGGRVAQGLGAGVILSALIVLVWERRGRMLPAVWAGTFTAVLLVAMPAALYATPLPDGVTPPGDWRVAFGPYPETAAAALIAALACMVLRNRDSLPVPRHTERGQLLLPAVPAAGFAFLSVVTTYGWSPGAQLVVGCIALVALLGLAIVGSRDATTGSPLGCAVVMVTVGLLTYPVAGPLAGLASATAVANGAAFPLIPFAAAGAAAMLGALLAARMPRDAARGAVLGGHGLIIVALLLSLATDVASGGWLLMAPLIPLGAGAGMALAASLRGAGVGAALFGLALCLPAVLTGQLLVLSLQAGRLQRMQPITSAQQQLYGLTAGYRLWLIVAGVITVLLAAACLRVTATPARASRDTRPRRTGTPTSAPTP